MQSLQPLQTLSACLLFCLGATACAGSGPRAATAPASAESRTVVQVRNNNWADMVIYILQADTRQRLGTVTSMSRVVLELPNALEGPGTNLQLMADPIGGKEQFRTDPIRVFPGERVQLTIENNLAISNYSVWGR